jgi:hypothetical protein
MAGVIMMPVSQSIKCADCSEEMTGDSWDELVNRWHSSGGRLFGWPARALCSTCYSKIRRNHPSNTI